MSVLGPSPPDVNPWNRLVAAVAAPLLLFPVGDEPTTPDEADEEDEADDATVAAAAPTLEPLVALENSGSLAGFSVVLPALVAAELAVFAPPAAEEARGV